MASSSTRVIASSWEIREVITRYMNAVNHRRFDELHHCLTPTIIQNTESLTIEQIKRRVEDMLKATPCHFDSLDCIITDPDAQIAMARIVTRSSLARFLRGASPTEEPFEYSEHAFFEMEGHKISGILAVQDWVTFRAQAPTLWRSPNLRTSSEAMSRTQLETKYRAYIGGVANVANGARTADLEEFFHPLFTHDNRIVTVDEYGDLIRRTGLIQSLSIRLLVVDAETQQVGAILKFCCTLAGVPINFTEHAIYRFRDGKLDWITSIADTDMFHPHLQSAGRRGLAYA